MANYRQYTNLVTATQVIANVFTNENTDEYLISDDIVTITELTHLKPVLGTKFYTELKEQNNNIDVVLLDDAFQHRAVKAGFYILLTAFDDLFIDDFLLPTGNLRELKSGVNRADVIIVSKTPENTCIHKHKKY